MGDLYVGTEPSFWDNRKIKRVAPLSRYAYQYLYTNPDVSVSGIYSFIRAIAIERTGIPDFLWIPILNDLVKARLIHFDPMHSIIWIRGKWKHRPAKMGTHCKRLGREFLNSSSLPYWKDFFLRYFETVKYLERKRNFSSFSAFQKSYKSAKNGPLGMPYPHMHDLSATVWAKLDFIPCYFDDMPDRNGDDRYLWGIRIPHTHRDASLEIYRREGGDIISSPLSSPPKDKESSPEEMESPSPEKKEPSESPPDPGAESEDNFGKSPMERILPIGKLGKKFLEPNQISRVELLLDQAESILDKEEKKAGISGSNKEEELEISEIREILGESPSKSDSDQETLHPGSSQTESEQSFSRGDPINPDFSIENPEPYKPFQEGK